MINKLIISNFKCFQSDSEFKFSKLNLLTGINGRGKSTILQAILILAQSIRSNSEIPELLINGEFIELGNFVDIKNSETPRGTDISFSFDFNDSKIKTIISFDENENNPLTAKFKSITPGEEHQYFFQQLGKIHYIGANRLGPVKFVEKVNLPSFLNVGSRGQYAINILAKNDIPSVNEILYLGKDSDSLMQQTQEWLSYILEGAKINIEGKEESSSVLSLLVNNRNTSYSYKTNNVGFGYSYILPLVVTGLIAQAGEIVIIENPEAHLHPRAQARIMEFFSKVAACDVQVFIESHSEHILNGIRVSALNPSININSSDVSIQYFDESFEPLQLTLDNKGKIANWPTGFFDQQEMDLSEIFKLSRN